MPDSSAKTRIRIVATPRSTVSPVTGFYETLRSVGALTAPEDRPSRDTAPFDVEIVGEAAGPIESAKALRSTRTGRWRT